jgi:hypothetical protein
MSPPVPPEPRPSVAPASDRTPPVPAPPEPCAPPVVASPLPDPELSMFVAVSALDEPSVVGALLPDLLGCRRALGRSGTKRVLWRWGLRKGS